jgi:hypothetical protein
MFAGYRSVGDSRRMKMSVASFSSLNCASFKDLAPLAPIYRLQRSWLIERTLLVESFACRFGTE